MGQVIGALGDIHGDFDAARRIMSRHPDVAFWVCVGDVADAGGRYEPLPAPLYWIKGNNENFDAIAGGGLPDTLHFMPNGQLLEIEGLRIAGLGGTLAPSWYDTPAAALPHPTKRTRRATEAADKRRHFVKDEVEACKRLRGVDLFLTHEAPHPFKVRGIPAGKTPINDVLAAMKPRLHLFGHHHQFVEIPRGSSVSVGLDLIPHSYLLVDGATLSYERRH